MKKRSLIFTLVLLLTFSTQVFAITGGGTFQKFTFGDEPLTEQTNSTDEEYSFIGKISLAMNMSKDTLWSSSSSAAFGAVTVIMDILSETEHEVEFDSISDVYLAKIRIQNEGIILAYYFFSDESCICAIFNPDTGEITVSAIEYDTTPKRAMYLFANAEIIEDYRVVDLDDIEAILGELLAE